MDNTENTVAPDSIIGQPVGLDLSNHLAQQNEQPPAPINIMIDLETLGKKRGCKILSIGATTFLTQAPPSKFYFTANRDGQCGLEEDTETVTWWQSEANSATFEALLADCDDSPNLIDVLEKFCSWIESLGSRDQIIVWSKGASFDLQILQEAFEVTGIACPWDFRNEMCFRTLYNLYSDIVLQPTLALRKHHALDDAIFQALHAQDIFMYQAALIQNSQTLVEIAREQSESHSKIFDSLRSGKLGAVG